MTFKISQTQINFWFLSAKERLSDSIISIAPILIGTFVWFLSGGAQFHGIPLGLFVAANASFALILLMGDPFSDFLDIIMPLYVGTLAMLGVLTFTGVDLVSIQIAVSIFMLCMTCVMWIPFAYMKSKVMRARAELQDARRRAAETLERSRQITDPA